MLRQYRSACYAAAVGNLSVGLTVAIQPQIPPGVYGLRALLTPRRWWRLSRYRVVVCLVALPVAMDEAVGCVCCGEYCPEHGRPMLLQNAQVRANYLRPGKSGRDDKHHRVGGTHYHASGRAALQGRTIHNDEIAEMAELLKMLQIEPGFTAGRQPGASRDHLQTRNRRYGNQQ